MQNRPEYLAAWAGLAKAGVTTALLNTNLTGRTLGHAIDAADTRRLIVGSECLPNYQSLGADAPEGLEVHVAADPATASASSLPPGSLDFQGELASRSTQNPDPSVRAEVHSGDPLVLIYTSGTTGLPKAAKMSHLRFSMIGICPQIAGFGRTAVMYCALPSYATPVFVRLQPEPEITGTFKLRKVDLQSEGYDSDAIEDPLYVRDDSQREYVELTPARLRAVKSGELRV